MPLSRSPRMDRRRRAIREGLVATSQPTDDARISPSRTARQAVDLSEPTKKDRGVAYSHSVRGACQHRLVQFIPVRKLSLTGAIAGSVAVPLVLMTLHYLVFVSGSLDWSGHPMSTLLNANSPRSLAAWLSSHLWLLCLAATILTFRLRRHKLDDYEGEYRLWFWLVFTCVIGSIDSTTRMTELFAAALDRWSQLHVGWTGGALVQATLASLIGMLGIRLCGELKTVPASVVLWLLGLACWGGSAALSQSLLRLDMSDAMRGWMRASLWLGGLTSIWLSGLLFLRSVFMDAQQRFLARAVMAAAQSAVPWRQRLKEAMPKMPSLPKFGRRSDESQMPDADEQSANQSRRQKLARERAAARAQADADEAAYQEDEALQSTATATAASARSPEAQAAEIENDYGKRPSWFRRRARSEQPRQDDEDETAPRAKQQQPREADRRAAQQRAADQRSGQRRDAAADDAEQSPAKRSLRERLSWKRKSGDDDAQPKVRPQKQRAAAQSESDADDGSEGASSGGKRRWLAKPKMPKLSLPKPRIPKPRMPKLKLPSFRLPTPQESDGADGQEDASRSPRPGSSRPLPSTSGPVPFRPGNDAQDSDDNARGMSKAERKRLRRLQRDDDGERRAA